MLKYFTYIAGFISARFSNLYQEDECLELAKDKVMELKKHGKKEGTTLENMTGNRTCSWRHKSWHDTL